MEVVRHGIETLALAVALCGWVICIPQFKLLFQTKDSRSNSLFLSIGGLVFQAIFFTNALLQGNLVFVFSMGTGLINGIVMIGLIAYYRAYPDGKAKVKTAAPSTALGLHLVVGKAPIVRRTGESPSRHPARVRALPKIQNLPPRRWR